MRQRLIVDAHEDIAWATLALGRDYLRSARETRRLEEGTEAARRNGQCMLGLPEWLEGHIALICGSIYLTPHRVPELSWDPQSYRDAEEAYRRANEQVDAYERLADRSDRIRLVTDLTSLEEVLASWEGETPQVGIIPALEGADLIRRKEDVEHWYRRGAPGRRVCMGSGLPLRGRQPEPRLSPTRAATSWRLWRNST
ncbi:MAG: hypothetical protein RMK65_09270 [Anaerolineae bacterium]|nr:hypothetical protein [Anaerolineae bacterium]